MRLHTSIAMSVMTAMLNDTIAYCFWESGRLVFSDTILFFSLLRRILFWKWGWMISDRTHQYIYASMEICSRSGYNAWPYTAFIFIFFFFMIFVLSLGEDDDENDGMR